MKLFLGLIFFLLAMHFAPARAEVFIDGFEPAFTTTEVAVVGLPADPDIIVGSYIEDRPSSDARIRVIVGRARPVFAINTVSGEIVGISWPVAGAVAFTTTRAVEGWILSNPFAPPVSEAAAETLLAQLNLRRPTEIAALSAALSETKDPALLSEAGAAALAELWAKSVLVLAEASGSTKVNAVSSPVVVTGGTLTQAELSGDVYRISPKWPGTAADMLIKLQVLTSRHVEGEILPPYISEETRYAAGEWLPTSLAKFIADRLTGAVGAPPLFQVAVSDLETHGRVYRGIVALGESFTQTEMVSITSINLAKAIVEPVFELLGAGPGTCEAALRDQIATAAAEGALDVVASGTTSLQTITAITMRAFENVLSANPCGSGLSGRAAMKKVVGRLGKLFGTAANPVIAIINSADFIKKGVVLSNSIIRLGVMAGFGFSESTMTVMAGPIADLSLTKSLSTSGPFTVGQSVSWTIQVSNAGPSVAQDIVVEDVASGVSNLRLQSATPGCIVTTCTFQQLSVGGTITMTAMATVEGPGSFVNSAYAHSVTPDPDETNNSDSDGSDLSSNVGFVSLVSQSMSMPPEPGMEGVHFYSFDGFSQSHYMSFECGTCNPTRWTNPDGSFPVMHIARASRAGGLSVPSGATKVCGRLGVHAGQTRTDYSYVDKLVCFPVIAPNVFSLELEGRDVMVDRPNVSAGSTNVANVRVYLSSITLDDWTNFQVIDAPSGILVTKNGFVNEYPCGGEYRPLAQGVNVERSEVTFMATGQLLMCDHDGVASYQSFIARGPNLAWTLGAYSGFSSILYNLFVDKNQP